MTRLHRLKATAALDAYTRAQTPTTTLLHSLADSFATMIAADFTTSVTILVRGIAITREPTAPAQIGQRKASV